MKRWQGLLPHVKLQNLFPLPGKDSDKEEIKHTRGQKVAYLVECNRVAFGKPDEGSDDDEIEGLGTATMGF